MAAAGLPPESRADLRDDYLSPLEKWSIAEPFLLAARNTGYLRAVDLSTDKLFGMQLAADTCEAIDVAARDSVALATTSAYSTPPASNAVKSIRSTVRTTRAPTAWDEPLDQDLSLYPLVTGRHPRAEALAGIDVCELGDYEDVIEACFERSAHRRRSREMPLGVLPPPGGRSLRCSADAGVHASSPRIRLGHGSTTRRGLPLPSRIGSRCGTRFASQAARGVSRRQRTIRISPTWHITSRTPPR